MKTEKQLNGIISVVNGAFSPTVRKRIEDMGSVCELFPEFERLLIKCGERKAKGKELSKKDESRLQKIESELLKRLS